MIQAGLVPIFQRLLFVLKNKKNNENRNNTFGCFFLFLFLEK